MFKNLSILATLAVIVALPFLMRRHEATDAWTGGDPVLVIVTPHNEGIRHEFGLAFSRWHQQHYGKPVKIEWRSIGGATEIMRYLSSEFSASARVWWEETLRKPWPMGGTDTVTGPSQPKDAAQAELYRAFRTIDDPRSGHGFTSRIDLFFGGGEFDHADAYDRGLTIEPWPAGKEPRSLFIASDGTPLIPERVSGEVWRRAYLFGNAVSTFGICYNIDRLRDLKVSRPPTTWDDLGDPVYFRQVGMADPDKSGSVAKAFENLIHQKISQRVQAAGFTPAQVATYEKLVGDFIKAQGPKYARGQLPPTTVPAAYQDAIERGWEDGVALVQRIGANARYVTDSGSKVPIDVSVGDAAIGMAIDFYGRYQAQNSLGPDGKPHMEYLTPAGGSSVSCDPISLLRGAENREVAVRFIEFVLSEEGQRLWTYNAGTPGGPEQYTLRRLPIRRDFYPSTNPAMSAKAAAHTKLAADNLADPSVDPYKLAAQFEYQRRWTAQHFGVQRKIIRAMCQDAGDELRDAWGEIRDHGGPDKCPQAMAQLRSLPVVMLKGTDGVEREVALTWRNAPDIVKQYDPMDYMREWTAFYRQSYIKARALAREGK